MVTLLDEKLSNKIIKNNKQNAVDSMNNRADSLWKELDPEGYAEAYKQKKVDTKAEDAAREAYFGDIPEVQFEENYVPRTKYIEPKSNVIEFTRGSAYPSDLATIAVMESLKPSVAGEDSDIVPTKDMSREDIIRRNALARGIK